MAIDPRKLETELVGIFRDHGIRTTDFDGIQYVGLCSVRLAEKGPYVPTIPHATAAISIKSLAEQIVERFA